MTNGPRRVVLITGASSGIGRATAELLAARGHRVFGGVRAVATTRPLVGVELVSLDVRDDASAKACVEEMRSRAGRIDVLINNAGVNLVGAVEETSISQAQALFDTNVIGALRMIQAVLPGMRRQGTGLIVNISSILGASYQRRSWASMRAPNTLSKGCRNRSTTKCRVGMQR